MRYADMLVVEPGEDGSSLMTGMVFVLGPAPLPIPPVLEPLGPILMTTLPRSPMLGPAPLPMPPVLEPSGPTFMTTLPRLPMLGPAPLPMPPVLEPLGPILMTTLPRLPMLGPALPMPPVLEPLGPILMTTLPRSPMLGPAPLPMPPTLEPPAGFTAMMVEPLPAEEPAAFWSRFSNVASAEPEPAVDGGLICMICDG